MLVKTKMSSFIKEAKKFWRVYKRNTPAIGGLLVLIFFLFISTMAPYISTHAPMETGVAEQFTPPTLEYPMGVDDLGRDIYSEIIWGSRVSIMVGFLAAGLATFIGVILGLTSGYYGGKIDSLLMRFTEVYMVMPVLFLGVLLAALFGSNIWNVILVISVTIWPRTARLLRSQVLSEKEKMYVEAARSVGMTDAVIMFSEILPNCMFIVVVNASFTAAQAILMESSLSFLGLADPSFPSWGLMIDRAQKFIRRSWWMGVFPGLAIILLVLSLNLIGDGLNEALNPRIKRLKRMRG